MSTDNPLETVARWGEEALAKRAESLQNPQNSTDSASSVPAKHTPGPWFLEPQFANGVAEQIYSRHGGLAIVDTTSDEGRANARLIAQAPELAERVVQLEREKAELVGALREAARKDEDLVPIEVCLDCPLLGYPTDKTRCNECPKRAEPARKEGASE